MVVWLALAEEIYMRSITVSTPPASIRTVSASLYQTLPLKQNQHTAMLPGVYLNWKTLIRLIRLFSAGILNRAAAIQPYGGSIFRPLNPVQTLTLVQAPA
jgi:hypothetical protein